ncbi:MAG: peptidylprolyl isomerase [Nitrospinae bacterium CG11_big_fil_rev_8_21_14_0_20_56_8]|nr:MAG: peptidylprolyl isomerase [Nitrospinae bacterium CG11_big_fil_rev_8_21_14_0_20_56_8]
MTLRSIRVSHIVTSTREIADMLIESLQSCESQELMLKMFARLAKKYSACGTRDKGGDLGFLEFNTSAPELEKAAMATPIGELGGPVKSRFGYHIFVVTDEAKLVDTGKDGTDLPLGAGPGTL